MKRIFTCILTVILLLSLAVPVHSATLDSGVGTVNTVNYSLNVRSGPSTSAGILSALPKGSYVTLTEKAGNWWQVEYASGRYGYCHADYIKETTATASTVNASSGLNVRSGPGTSYKRITTLPKGTVVMVLANSNGWSRILYNGTRTGYVSAQYLTAGQASSNALSLHVPQFKQTDTRWANVKIGSSGKTMAQIGCATTAIAMMESYRTGTTVYPDAMAKKLRYTASGDVYWPGNFVPVTRGADYLTGIYKLLTEGKPVLFGAKTSAGKQHWVVITGYRGGDALTASGFTINDPATASRTNLQQLLNSYPVFYKYFYYK